MNHLYICLFVFFIIQMGHMVPKASHGPQTPKTLVWCEYFSVYGMSEEYFVIPVNVSRYSYGFVPISALMLLLRQQECHL